MVSYSFLFCPGNDDEVIINEVPNETPAGFASSLFSAAFSGLLVLFYKSQGVLQERLLEL